MYKNNLNRKTKAVVGNCKSWRFILFHLQARSHLYCPSAVCLFQDRNVSELDNERLRSEFKC